MYDAFDVEYYFSIRANEDGRHTSSPRTRTQISSDLKRYLLATI